MRERLDLLTLSYRCHYLRLQLVYKMVNDWLTVSGNFKGILHWDQNWSEMYKRAMGQPTFVYATAKEWNDLPEELHACEMLRIF